MTSNEEQKNNIPNPFLNPIGFWQYYILTWIEVSRGSYVNAMRAGENWVKALCDPWLKPSSSGEKETAKKE